jgi:hypothetical protein
LPPLNEIPLPRFKKKSSWIPKPSKNTTLESFIDLVKNDVQTATSTNIPTHDNLTPAEKGALHELKERDDIVIKSADKGRKGDLITIFRIGRPIYRTVSLFG